MNSWLQRTAYPEDVVHEVLQAVQPLGLLSEEARQVSRDEVHALEVLDLELVVVQVVVQEALRFLVLPPLTSYSMGLMRQVRSRSSLMILVQLLLVVVREASRTSSALSSPAYLVSLRNQALVELFARGQTGLSSRKDVVQAGLPQLFLHGFVQKKEIKDLWVRIQERNG